MGTKPERQSEALALTTDREPKVSVLRPKALRNKYAVRTEDYKTRPGRLEGLFRNLRRPTISMLVPLSLMTKASRCAEEARLVQMSSPG